MNIKLLAAATLACSAILGQQTQAATVTLLPGTTVFPTLTTVSGTLLAQTTQPFTTPSVDMVTGTIENWVYSRSGGLLTFVYQINVTGSALPGAGIEHFTANNFAGFITAVGIDTSSGIDIPLTVNRALPGTPIAWNFGGNVTGNEPVLVGTSSVLLVIDSNATSFGTAVDGLIDGATANVTLFGPTESRDVPDGGLTLCFLGVALSMVEIIRRRCTA